MKMTRSLYFSYSMASSSVMGAHIWVSQKPGVVKAMATGLPDVTASAMVNWCHSGSGGSAVSISERSDTSARVSWRLLGAGSPMATEALFSCTVNFSWMGASGGPPPGKKGKGGGGGEG